MLFSCNSYGSSEFTSRSDALQISTGVQDRRKASRRNRGLLAEIRLASTQVVSLLKTSFLYCHLRREVFHLRSAQITTTPIFAENESFYDCSPTSILGFSSESPILGATGNVLTRCRVPLILAKSTIPIVLVVQNSSIHNNNNMAKYAKFRRLL